MKPSVFSDINAYAQDLAQMYGERDTLLQEMEKIYHLEWAEAEKLKEQFAFMYITISPGARNAIKTAIRLMTASYPRYNVPKELQREIGMDVGDKIEKMCAVMMRSSDRITGQPLHMDATLSGLLYDEIHISINPTWEIAEYAKGGSKAQQQRTKRIADATPFLFQVHSPIGCYPDWDYLGLRAWARKVTMKRGEILDTYGAEGERALGAKKGSGFDDVELWTYWDLENRACWIDGSADPIYLEPHDLPVIPIAVHKVEGSRLFADIIDQTEPFLFTLYESGLWNRQNLMLSTMYTNAASRLWGSLVYTGPAGTEPQVDYRNPMGIISVEPGTTLDTFRQNLIDPGLTQMWAMSEQLGTESTIYKQVAGQSLGPNATYSETALLSQSGRLPLVAIQRKSGWAIGDALKVAFAIMRDTGGKYKGREGTTYAELKASDVPESLEIEVTLETALPQDKMQQANQFNILYGKLSDEWLMEHILDISNPTDMQKQIMTEQATKLQFQLYLQKFEQRAQQMAQMEQAAMMQSMQGAAPVPGLPGGAQGMPQGLPPNETMSNPMMGGVPPEVMQGGGQGPLPPNYEEGMNESNLA